MIRKKSLTEIQKKFSDKFPNSNIEILEILDGARLLVKDFFGQYVVYSFNLFKTGSITIQSALNKERYLINKIKERFPENLDKFNLIKYYSDKNIIISVKGVICKTNTESILSGKIPQIQSAINKTEYFLNKLPKKLVEKYDFSRFNYINSKTKGIVVCNTHGEFLINPSQLLKGHSCIKCGREVCATYHAKNPLGWSLSNWYKKAKESKYYESFKVYIIECTNEKEKFYKIGRTFVKIKQRFSGKIDLPYNYKIIKTYEFKEITLENATNCFNLEIKLKQKNKIYKYIPKISFKGMQECFLKLNKLE